MTEAQLRNSAADILTAIATDMRETQSAAQQETKSRGDKDAPNSNFDRVARLHADDHLSHGFSIDDVVAEFRSLRATVLRRWQKTSPGGTAQLQAWLGSQIQYVAPHLLPSITGIGSPCLKYRRLFCMACVYHQPASGQGFPPRTLWRCLPGRGGTTLGGSGIGCALGRSKIHSFDEAPSMDLRTGA
ncbi:MAG: hypothetical protein ACTHNZ_06190 [Trinickia sp.]|uniref:hypothetical protein n=1 Tax=Trinickia sp. TaxID=2571163 RepID=UPI003F7D5EBB